MIDWPTLHMKGVTAQSLRLHVGILCALPACPSATGPEIVRTQQQ